jgi:c-di-GMP-binding flagellar brake protein YcgR
MPLKKDGEEETKPFKTLTEELSASGRILYSSEIPTNEFEENSQLQEENSDLPPDTPINESERDTLLSNQLQGNFVDLENPEGHETEQETEQEELEEEEENQELNLDMDPDE